jgi:hypothetical protein
MYVSKLRFELLARYPSLPLARGKRLAGFTTLCFKEDMLDYILLTLNFGGATYGRL